MPFGFHPSFLIILLIIVLIVFGPGKLPELGNAVGRTMREFRKASDDLSNPPPSVPAPKTAPEKPQEEDKPA